MNSTDSADRASATEAVGKLFRELASGLPANTVVLEETSDSRSVMYTLTPTRANAAPLCAILPARGSDGVTLIGGRGSFFEIPSGGRRYTSRAFVEELRSICQAVIAGRLEEWVLLDGEDVLRGRGVLDLPPPMTVRWGQLSFRLLGRTRKAHYRYAPWIEDAS